MYFLYIKVIYNRVPRENRACALIRSLYMNDEMEVCVLLPIHRGCNLKKKNLTLPPSMYGDS